MFRLAYRNFGDHEALVGNFTVSGSGIAGTRWFELRGVSNGPESVFQEGTYSPDSTHRWMASAAMNGAGDLAVGFSASDATIFPQIRYEAASRTTRSGLWPKMKSISSTAPAPKSSPVTDEAITAP